ncbi:MAG TPA: DUF2269 family protein [Gaiellaceae bacterium]|nr:DUF2269 family protein [Gaiellaceae bacterium]
MQTPSRSAASVPLTPIIGLGVLIVALLFAFESAWYPHWYAFFRLVHVTLAVVWVGGGALITVLALRADRARDAEELATIARQAAFAGERIFAPAGAVVFLMGIAMMIHTDWGWGKFWVVVGLLGYVSTFTTGVAVLSPMAKRITGLVEEKGATAPETQAAIRKVLLIARVDVAVLLLVIADMVTKPFS